MDYQGGRRIVYNPAVVNDVAERGVKLARRVREIGSKRGIYPRNLPPQKPSLSLYLSEKKEGSVNQGMVSESLERKII